MINFESREVVLNEGTKKILEIYEGLLDSTEYKDKLTSLKPLEDSLDRSGIKNSAPDLFLPAYSLSTISMDLFFQLTP